MHLLSLATLLPLVGFFLQASADLQLLNANSKQRSPNSYIVVLKPSTNRTQAEEHTHRITTYHRARSLDERAGTTGIGGSFNIDGTGPSFKGYNVHCDGRTLREILRSPEVQYVEADTKTKSDLIQSGSTWGLARISWRRLPKTYSYRYASAWNGIGITAYVVDSGVRITHQQFEGRARWGYNAVPRSSNTDKFGHGTHVAGTIAGKTYGVAKKAKIVAVKALDDKGDGFHSYTIACLNWIGRNAKAGKSVVNISLGGEKSKAVNDAVEALYKKGIVVVVSAGNKNNFASLYSPASAPNAITVAASTSGDERAKFSNYGTSVDIFAPGQNVLSAWYTSNTALKYRDGTSMAAPHVAGIAAYLLSSKVSYQSPLTIRNRIVTLSRKGYISKAGTGTVNRLAWNGYLSN
ncbi:hypothetical protein TWF225_010440 [Orbilia oligospora]|uniref:Cuticle-degrading serine protease n=1 Tax=Orbilia oligospora TaxID=2813651 RepID=A0A7C8PF77_ORBOL|nr:hypothetical protein TWF751_006800 [Orbilia oligospora]KAF3172047.1 hypothetical protein TWF225_010440 [Orbilia oligospora]KAF3237281.1 hypothetical protein TWF217_002167 [Orbilia oligospora]KAF3255524.1 hypothetical protein TWF128_005528 [Orbilia oligospora]KAF3297480.1 hypothetical protein TWF132_007568 [Orbilia oligospora]